MAHAWIGTSGFSYKEWKGSFYPEDLSDAEFLAYYASRLTSVEIDRTFYRMPNLKTIEAWRDGTPERFRFAIKASRKITHFDRLKTPSESLAYLAGAVSQLESRLGVLFFQCPPTLKRDDERLKAFLGALPPGLPTAFEFRHDTWFVEEVYELLRGHGAALCIHDADEATTPIVLTAPRCYVRLRKSSYTTQSLAEWRERIRAWTEQGTDVFAYLKHDENPEAPAMALELARGLT